MWARVGLLFWFVRSKLLKCVPRKQFEKTFAEYDMCDGARLVPTDFPSSSMDLTVAAGAFFVYSIIKKRKNKKK